MEDRVEIKEEMNQQRLEEKMKMRKTKIRDVVMMKRQIDTHMNEVTLQKEVNAQEELEVEREERKKKGIITLTKHFRYNKRKSKKKCWFCSQPNTLKEISKYKMFPL